MDAQHAGSILRLCTSPRGRLCFFGLGTGSAYALTLIRVLESMHQCVKAGCKAHPPAYLVLKDDSLLCAAWLNAGPQICPPWISVICAPHTVLSHRLQLRGGPINVSMPQPQAIKLESSKYTTPATYLALSSMLLVSMRGRWLAPGMVCMTGLEAAACKHTRTSIKYLHLQGLPKPGPSGHQR